MKINELVNIMNQNKGKLTKAEQVQAMLKKELEVKEYISIKEKKQLVQDIVDECILYEDGVFKFDDIDKYVCFTMRTIAAYTDIELSNDIENDYDMLCENKLLNVIIDMFKKEYEEVSILLQMRCDYILNDNNIAIQVGKFLTDFSNKIDSIGDALENKINNFSLDKLPIGKEELVKVLEFVNKYQK